MCGRFTLTVELSEIQQDLGLSLDTLDVDWSPRFNIAPTQTILAINDVNKRTLQPMRWGLVPFWAKDMAIGSKMINARSETLDEKPSFRKSLQTKRCLILADGFYEWKTVQGKTKVPYYFHLKGYPLFTFAGLWDIWKPGDGDPVTSCTIITCEANDCVSPIHPRMPVILDKNTCWQWLEKGSATEFRKILQPYPSEHMLAYPVNRNVNDPKADRPELIHPETSIL